MTKHLYLLRHAKSVDKLVGAHDKDRELSPTGRKECLKIGNYLFHNGIVPELIISSSAVRTRSTSQLIAEVIKFNLEKILIEDKLYESSMQSFLNIIKDQSDELNHVMFVAHNPAIADLAEHLTKGNVRDMTTAGLAIIKFNINSWREVMPGNGELIKYIYPSMLLIEE